MAGFTESGITLEFDDFWFRFQGSKVFSGITGIGNKEMDACYRDRNDKIFYAIELKDYSGIGSIDKSNVQQRICNIIKKSIDTLQMLLSVKFRNSFGEALETEFNTDFLLTNLPVRLITIINVSPSNEMMVNALQTKCMSLLKPYSKIWDNVSFSIVTYRQAKKFLSFVK